MSIRSEMRESEKKYAEERKKVQAEKDQNN